MCDVHVQRENIKPCIFRCASISLTHFAAGLVIMIAIWISVRIFLMIAKIAKIGYSVV